MDNRPFGIPFLKNLKARPWRALPSKPPTKGISSLWNPVIKKLKDKTLEGVALQTTYQKDFIPLESRL
jgi:hypothetical protein